MDARIIVPDIPGENLTDELYRLLQDGYVDTASNIAESVINDRIAGGDSDLVCVRLLLQYYQATTRFHSYLDDQTAAPLRPDERLYACFDKLVELLRHQERQISALQAMLAELL